MSIDPDDSELERALRSDLPSTDAKERVRRRLLAAGVAVGNGMAATTSVAATGTAATGTAATGAAATGVFAKTMGASWGIKLGLAAAITIPSVGLLVEASPPARAVQAVPATTRIETPNEAARTPALSPAPEATAALEVAHPEEPHAATGPATVESPPSAPALAPHTELPSPPTRAPSTLADETRLLDGAFAALAAGDRERAASLIGEHEARFPAGLLQKERNRAKSKLSEKVRGE